MTDAEIVKHLAEKVMGWTVADKFGHSVPYLRMATLTAGFRYWPGDPKRPFVGAWNPLESIADAFEVLAKFCQPDRAHFVMGAAPCGQVTVWLVDWTWAIAKRQNVVPEMHDPAILGSYTGDTIPCAICLAMVEATR